MPQCTYKILCIISSFMHSTIKWYEDKQLLVLPMNCLLNGYVIIWWFTKNRVKHNLLRIRFIHFSS